LVIKRTVINLFATFCTWEKFTHCQIRASKSKKLECYSEYTIMDHSWLS